MRKVLLVLFPIAVLAIWWIAANRSPTSPGPDGGEPGGPLRLTPQESIQVVGRCVSAHGPVVDAQVSLKGAAKRRGANVLVGGITDSEGAFALSVAPGRGQVAFLFVNHPHHAPACLRVAIPRRSQADVQVGDVLMIPSKPIVARVVDANGRPLAERRIRWRTAGAATWSAAFPNDRALQIRQEARTDASGLLQLQILPDAWLAAEVLFEEPDRWMPCEALRLDDDVPRPLVIRVAADKQYAVRIRGEGDDEPTDVRFSLAEPAFDTDLPLPAVRADAPYVWHLPLNTRSSGRVRVQAPGYRSGAVHLRRDRSDLGEVTLIRGQDELTVMLDGAEPGERVTTGLIGSGWRLHRFPALSSQRVQADRTVRLRGAWAPVTAKLAVICVSASGERLWRSDPLKELDLAPRASPVRLRPEPCPTIAVRCVDESERPVPDARVRLLRGIGSSGRRLSPFGARAATPSGFASLDDAIWETVTDAAGMARLPCPDAFHFVVTAKTTGSVEAREELSASSENRRSLEIRLRRGGTLHARIAGLGAFGPGDVVAVHVGTKRIHHGSPIDKDVAGFSGAEPGTYVVGYAPLLRYVAAAAPADLVRLSGLTGVQDVVVQEDKEHEVVLPAVSGLSAIVGTLESIPGGDTPHMVDALPSGMSSGSVPMGAIRMRGRADFVIRSLLPGTYDIRMIFPGRPPHSAQQVSLEPAVRKVVRIPKR